MDPDEGSSADRDLLSRLNALKKSTIDLDEKTYTSPRASEATASIDPHPALSLHPDLVNRFKSLSGKTADAESATGEHPAVSSEVDKNEDEKTIEELLADLGPSEQWDVNKSEHAQVEDLLRAANTALSEGPKLEKAPVDDTSEQPAPTRLPAVDVSVFQPEPESEEDEEPKQRKPQIRDGLNQEADDVLQRLMDEAKFEQKHAGEKDKEAEEGSDSGSEDEAGPGWALPDAPSKAPDSLPDSSVQTNGDEDLAARFANLSLPSVPTILKSSTNTQPTATANKFADEDIDSWCIICNDDATLSCLGCDGDLYCTNCWMEGHRSEDAGYEERSHKAVQYVKGGGKKKQKARRLTMGA